MLIPHQILVLLGFSWWSAPLSLMLLSEISRRLFSPSTQQLLRHLCSTLFPSFQSCSLLGEWVFNPHNVWYFEASLLQMTYKQSDWLTDWLFSVIFTDRDVVLHNPSGITIPTAPYVSYQWNLQGLVRLLPSTYHFTWTLICNSFLLQIVCLFVCTFATLWDSKFDRHFFSSFQNVGTVSIHHIDLIPYHMEKSSQTITCWNWSGACFWHWMINVIYLPLLYHFMSL